YITTIATTIDRTALHSCPTRRSSDLDPSPRQPACGQDEPVATIRQSEDRRHLGQRGRRGPRRRRSADRDRAQAAQPPERHVDPRSEEHTSELQSRENLVCRLLLEKKK